MIDGKNVFDQPVKNDVRTYNIKKIATDKGNDYTRWAKKTQLNLNGRKKYSIFL